MNYACAAHNYCLCINLLYELVLLMFKSVCGVMDSSQFTL